MYDWFPGSDKGIPFFLESVTSQLLAELLSIDQQDNFWIYT